MKNQTMVIIAIYISTLYLLVFLNQYAIYNGNINYTDLIPNYVGPTQKSTQIIMYNLNKIKNMNADFALVGNSRTKYNVDSKLIQEISGLTGYNSGMASFHYVYWPTLLTKILKPGNLKYIVYQIDLDFLYSTNDISLKNESQIEILNGRYNSFSSLVLFFKAYKNGETSFLELMLFSKYTISSFFNFSYLENSLKHNFQFRSKNQTFDDHLAQIFSETKVFHCENNDGYMVSESHPQIKPLKELDTSKINSNTLFFIKEFIQQAKIKNIKPIIVLLPTFGIHTSIKTKYLETILNAPVIDMSNININDHTLWVDTAHLNKTGRREYTKVLGEKLKNIFDN